MDVLCIIFTWNMQSSVIHQIWVLFYKRIWKVASLCSVFSFLYLGFFFSNPQHTVLVLLVTVISTHVCIPTRLGAHPNRVTELFIFKFLAPSTHSVAHNRCLMRGYGMKEGNKMKGDRILRLREGIWPLLVPYPVLASKGSQKSFHSSIAWRV